MEETPQELRNRRYIAYREKHPGHSYAQWLHDAAVIHARNGSPHATLGGNLNKNSDWWEAGRGAFERYRKLFPIPPDAKVVDYGCGSLRIGAHFIRAQDPGKYFGLDVTTGLVEVGKDLVGPEIIAEKAPQFGAIEEASLAKAAAFGADLVYSTAVCYHVHPDEAPAYFANLLRLTAKPGAMLAFDLSLSDEPVPDAALSKPIGYFIEQLKPLEFVAFHRNAEREGGRQVLGIAQFRRAEAAAPQAEEPRRRKKRKRDLSLPRKKGRKR